MNYSDALWIQWFFFWFCFCLQHFFQILNSILACLECNLCHVLHLASYSFRVWSFTFALSRKFCPLQHPQLIVCPLCLPAPTSAAALTVQFPSQISSSALLLPSVLWLGLVFSFPSPSAILVYSEAQDPYKKRIKINKNWANGCIFHEYKYNWRDQPQKRYLWN